MLFYFFRRKNNTADLFRASPPFTRLVGKGGGREEERERGKEGDNSAVCFSDQITSVSIRK